MVCTFAHLEDKKLSELKALEQKLGKIILAYSCGTATAQLKEPEIMHLQISSRPLPTRAVISGKP